MIRLINLKNDEVKIKEHNDLCEELKKDEPSIDWDNVKINTIYDEFEPYNSWLRKLDNEKDIYIIEDTIEDIENVYISDLNWDSQLERLTDYKLVKKYREFNYGVCDNASQVIEDCNKKIANGEFSKEKEFIIVMTPIFKENQGEEGWRWHKWGAYIGTQNPKREYIADEDDIDMVYVFRVKEVSKINED